MEHSSTPRGASIDAAKIKAAASGHWPEILATVGRIDPALLDGKHHPCPKCGGKDRFRLIDADAGAVYCHQCFNAGNGDGLAAIAWMRGCGFKETCREVAAYLRLNGKPPSHDDAAPTTAKAPQAERADTDTLHRAHSLLLSKLSLAADHRAALRRRGLSDEDIDRGGYRTWDPADPHQAVRAVFAELGSAIDGVPGFHNGRLAAAAGLLIPVRDLAERIIALKVRPDDAGDGPKYFYVSSAKHDGPSPGAPPHVPVGIKRPLELVRVTEGELKADLATALSDLPTVSLPGVKNWRAVVPVVAELVGSNPPGQRRVRIALDADAPSNPSVGKALFELVEYFGAEGYDAELERWSISDGKGIDDLLAAEKVPEVLTGDSVLPAAREIMAASVLYGLSALLTEPNRPVVVVQSEKNVDDLARIGVLGICMVGGVEKWTAKYAEVFRGRRVIVLVHDGGLSWQDAEKVALLMHSSGSPTVRIVELVEKGDLASWLTKDKLKALCKAAPTWLPNKRWPEIEPLTASELPEFPVEVLPPVLRAWNEAEALATQTPVDLAGLLSLAVISSCIARRVVVEPRDGWIERTNLYAAVLMEPGNRKSAVFSDAIAPLRELEADQIEAARPNWARERSARRQAEKRLAKLERIAGEKADISAREEAMELAERLAATPEPALPRLIVDDATPEKVTMLLEQQGGRIASMSPEGGVFDLMAGMYSQSGMANFGVYLMAHSGDDIVQDRVSRPTVRVRKPAIVSAYAIQPQVIQGLADKAAFRGKGLLARYLYAFPKSLIGQRRIAPPPVPADVTTAYWELVQRLGHFDGEMVLRLSHDAEAEFQVWEAEIEISLADGGKMELIRDWGGKLAGATLRLAAVLHCAEHGPQGAISNVTLRAAIAIARYLVPHAEAVLTMMGAKEKGPEDDAQYLLRWIKRHGKREFTKSEAQHHGKRRFPKAEAIDAALAELVKRHYIRELPATRSGSGRPPSPRYAVNPAAFADEKAEKRSRYSQNSNESAQTRSTAGTGGQPDVDAQQEPATQVAEPPEPVALPPSVVAQREPASLPLSQTDQVEQPQPGQKQVVEHEQEQQVTVPDLNCGNIGSAVEHSEEPDWWETKV